jgi:hypothetical protein
MYSPESFEGATASTDQSAQSPEAFVEEPLEGESQNIEGDSEAGEPVEKGSPTETPEETIDKTEEELNELYDELGVAIKTFGSARIAGLDIQPGSEQEELIAKIEALEGKKRAWAEKHGIENLPEGITLQDEDGDTKGGARVEIVERSLTPEERRKLIDEWKQESVEQFVKVYETHRATRDAVNLPQVLRYVRVNMPQMIEKKSQDFLDGKTEELPGYVWAKGKCTSLWDRLMGRPKEIKDFKLVFGNEVIPVAQTEIAPEASEEEKEGSKDDEEGNTGAPVEQNNGGESIS